MGLNGYRTNKITRNVRKLDVQREQFILVFSRLQNIYYASIRSKI